MTTGLGDFLYVACQAGVESVCKRLLASEHPELRFAFSRPGFLTFKTHGPRPLALSFEPRCAFARVSGLSAGPVPGADASDRAAAFWDAVAALPGRTSQLHVWPRLECLPDEQQPGEFCDEAIAALGPQAEQLQLPVNQPALANQQVLDCIVIDRQQWWIGLRTAVSVASRWVGGRPQIEPPQDMVSRAYLKMREALLWSRLPMAPGDTVVELGAAPGGACQALLEQGVQVIGVDPAEMDPIVLAHPHFRHLQRRSSQLPRKELFDAQWLVVDSNVAPGHTLETVERLMQHPRIRLRGLLLTLKFSDWAQADALNEILQRVGSWGFEVVRPRQLYHNRQELCLFAVRRKSMLRPPRLKATPR